jgi:hypothetical protein
MSQIEQYMHHGTVVSVQSALRGRHTSHCLCYQRCRFFKPNTNENCNIAQTLYGLNVAMSVVTPVWECAKYDQL